MKRGKNIKISGDKKSFKRSWKATIPERFYSHWIKGDPQNQIQFAFRNHWEVFNILMKSKLFNKGKRCLEVGCGRGSMSAYFSDNGFDCTLLDISSEAISAAQSIFKKNKLKGHFLVGDANNLQFKDNSFDVVVSIGLLEHFEDIESPIKEQIRILDRGGLFLGYIVPKYSNNIQKDYEWINNILKAYKKNSFEIFLKEKLFRSNNDSTSYIKVLKSQKLKGINSSGIYSLPMISHSVDFPFSLMPDEAEKEVVKHFKDMLSSRKKTKKHPWLCREGYGQAFLVWGYK